jgi:hypothetical protein
MAAHEGTRRIKAVGRTMLLGGAASAVTLVVCLALFRTSSIVMNLLPFMLVLIPLGVALWIGGWVVEGFLARPS